MPPPPAPTPPANHGLDGAPLDPRLAAYAKRNHERVDGSRGPTDDNERGAARPRHYRIPRIRPEGPTPGRLPSSPEATFSPNPSRTASPVHGGFVSETDAESGTAPADSETRPSVVDLLGAALASKHVPTLPTDASVGTALPVAGVEAANSPTEVSGSLTTSADESLTGLVAPPDEDVCILRAQGDLRAIGEGTAPAVSGVDAEAQARPEDGVSSSIVTVPPLGGATLDRLATHRPVGTNRVLSSSPEPSPLIPDDDLLGLELSQGSVDSPHVQDWLSIEGEFEATEATADAGELVAALAAADKDWDEQAAQPSMGETALVVFGSAGGDDVPPSPAPPSEVGEVEAPAPVAAPTAPGECRTDDTNAESDDGGTAAIGPKPTTSDVALHTYLSPTGRATKSSPVPSHIPTDLRGYMLEEMPAPPDGMPYFVVKCDSNAAKAHIGLPGFDQSELDRLDDHDARCVSQTHCEDASCPLRAKSTLGERAPCSDVCYQVDGSADPRTQAALEIIQAIQDDVSWRLIFNRTHGKSIWVPHVGGVPCLLMTHSVDQTRFTITFTDLIKSNWAKGLQGKVATRAWANSLVGTLGLEGVKASADSVLISTPDAGMLAPHVDMLFTDPRQRGFAATLARSARTLGFPGVGVVETPPQWSTVFPLDRVHYKPGAGETVAGDNPRIVCLGRDPLSSACFGVRKEQPIADLVDPDDTALGDREGTASKTELMKAVRRFLRGVGSRYLVTSEYAAWLTLPSQLQMLVPENCARYLLAPARLGSLVLNALQARFPGCLRELTECRKLGLETVEIGAPNGLCLDYSLLLHMHAPEAKQIEELTQLMARVDGDHLPPIEELPYGGDHFRYHLKLPSEVTTNGHRQHYPATDIDAWGRMLDWLSKEYDRPVRMIFVRLVTGGERLTEDAMNVQTCESSLISSKNLPPPDLDDLVFVMARPTRPASNRAHPVFHLVPVKLNGALGALTLNDALRHLIIKGVRCDWVTMLNDSIVRQIDSAGGDGKAQMRRIMEARNSELRQNGIEPSTYAYYLGRRTHLAATPFTGGVAAGRHYGNYARNEFDGSPRLSPSHQMRIARRNDPPAREVPPAQPAFARTPPQAEAPSTCSTLPGRRAQFTGGHWRNDRRARSPSPERNVSFNGVDTPRKATASTCGNGAGGLGDGNGSDGYRVDGRARFGAPPSAPADKECDSGEPRGPVSLLAPSAEWPNGAIRLALCPLYGAATPLANGGQHVDVSVGIDLVTWLRNGGNTVSPLLPYQWLRRLPWVVIPIPLVSPSETVSQVIRRLAAVSADLWRTTLAEVTYSEAWCQNGTTTASPMVENPSPDVVDAELLLFLRHTLEPEGIDFAEFLETVHAWVQHYPMAPAVQVVRSITSLPADFALEQVTSALLYTLMAQPFPSDITRYFNSSHAAPQTSPHPTSSAPAPRTGPGQWRMNFGASDQLAEKLAKPNKTNLLAYVHEVHAALTAMWSSENGCYILMQPAPARLIYNALRDRIGKGTLDDVPIHMLRNLDEPSHKRELTEFIDSGYPSFGSIDPMSLTEEQQELASDMAHSVINMFMAHLRKTTTRNVVTRAARALCHFTPKPREVTSREALSQFCTMVNALHMAVGWNAMCYLSEQEFGKIPERLEAVLDDPTLLQLYNLADIFVRDVLVPRGDLPNGLRGVRYEGQYLHYVDSADDLRVLFEAKYMMSFVETLEARSVADPHLNARVREHFQTTAGVITEDGAREALSIGALCLAMASDDIDRHSPDRPAGMRNVQPQQDGASENIEESNFGRTLLRNLADLHTAQRDLRDAQVEATRRTEESLGRMHGQVDAIDRDWQRSMEGLMQHNQATHLSHAQQLENLAANSDLRHADNSGLVTGVPSSRQQLVTTEPFSARLMSLRGPLAGEPSAPAVMAPVQTRGQVQASPFDSAVNRPSQNRFGSAPTRGNFRNDPTCSTAWNPAMASRPQQSRPWPPTDSKDSRFMGGGPAVASGQRGAAIRGPDGKLIPYSGFQAQKFDAYPAWYKSKLAALPQKITTEEEFIKHHDLLPCPVDGDNHMLKNCPYGYCGMDECVAKMGAARAEALRVKWQAREEAWNAQQQKEAVHLVLQQELGEQLYEVACYVCQIEDEGDAEFVADRLEVNIARLQELGERQ